MSEGDENLARLMAELGELLSAVDDDRYDLTHEAKRRLTAIGQLIHEIGGPALMSEVMLDVASSPSSRTESRREGALDRAWNGIGGWLA